MSINNIKMKIKSLTQNVAASLPIIWSHVCACLLRSFQKRFRAQLTTIIRRFSSLRLPRSDFAGQKNGCEREDLISNGFNSLDSVEDSNAYQMIIKPSNCVYMILT